MVADDKMVADKDDAMDTLSVAPAPEAGGPDRDPRQDAGQDESIQRRLEKDPGNVQAQLDNGLDESMDASDPISSTVPGSSTEPPASSGFDEAAEGR
ncbi:hypothetical protein [Sphingomonas bacterium]|uniref:hypothetical protein n=1 Tax=Sphingomonas bacterium TaxID=1895847 RepID=UPI0015776B33|nr:hypothetical protein [Sphingomonas bacterium]